MAISLSKGGNISLSKEDAGLKKLAVGLGWSARATEGKDFDLDAMAVLLGENGKALNDNSLIFHKNLMSADGSIKHTGDNRTGDGDGDDETITFDLANIPANVNKVMLIVDIYEGKERGQNFGQVSNAYIRCINDETNNEIARYDLSEDASIETCMIFGEIYRHNGEWKFRAVGQGYRDGLLALLLSYGLDVTK